MLKKKTKKDPFPRFDQPYDLLQANTTKLKFTKRLTLLF